MSKPKISTTKTEKNPEKLRVFGFDRIGTVVVVTLW